MKQFIIFDKKKKKNIRTYIGNFLGDIECVFENYMDSDKYVHVEVLEGQHVDGWSLNTDNISVYNTEYIKPNPLDDKAKILKYVKSAAVAKKHHTEIDYKVELQTSLFPKRVFVKGELQKVSWYSDEEMTDKVIDVDITYSRDAQGFANSRTTDRTWYNNNGEANKDKKTTKKLYDSNSGAQIKEGKTRRQNIIDGVIKPTLACMVETMIAEMPAEDILMQGRDFMDSISVEFSNFISISSTISDKSDLNYGRKAIVVALEARAASDATWLNNKPLQLDPTGQTSILDYLVEELNI